MTQQTLAVGCAIFWRGRGTLYASLAGAGGFLPPTGRRRLAWVPL